MTAPQQSHVDTGGGDMVGVAIGGTRNQATGVKTVAHGAGADAPVMLGQVMERLAELERAVEGAALSPELRHDALADVHTAREALSRPTPGLGRAEHALRGTAAELQRSGSAEAVTSVVTLATSLIEMLRSLAG